MRIGDASEVVGKLMAVRADELVIEATQRFRVSVDGETARQLRRMKGKKVGVACIDGKLCWRLISPVRRRQK